MEEVPQAKMWGWGVGLPCPLQVPYSPSSSTGSPILSSSNLVEVFIQLNV